MGVVDLVSTVNGQSARLSGRMFQSNLTLFVKITDKVHKCKNSKSFLCPIRLNSLLPMKLTVAYPKNRYSPKRNMLYNLEVSDKTK